LGAPRPSFPRPGPCSAPSREATFAFMPRWPSLNCFFVMNDRAPSWAAIVSNGCSTIFRRDVRHGESVEAFVARVKDNIKWLNEQRAACGPQPATQRLALFGKGVVPEIGKLAQLLHSGDRQTDQGANLSPDGVAQPQATETDPRPEEDVRREG
jgi:hypothetical protein